MYFHLPAPMYPFSSLKKLRPVQQHIAPPFIIWMKREAYETETRPPVRENQPLLSL